MTERENEISGLLRSGYKEIEGYPKYFVNSDGSVVDMICNYPRELRRYIDQYGNHIVTLKDENETPENFYVCYLVAALFVENENGYDYVKHSDGNKSNNMSFNLEWTNECNYKTVESPSIIKGHIKPRRDSKHVVCKETGEVYNTIKDASQELGVSSAYICKKLKSDGNIKGLHYFYEGCETEFTEELIECESLDNEYIMTFGSIREASRELGIDRRKIAEALRSDGIVGGYIFRIEECTI